LILCLKLAWSGLCFVKFSPMEARKRNNGVLETPMSVLFL